MADEALIRARVAGRQAANELAELYIAESARLKNEYGLEAAMAFLDSLRDALVQIRPLAEILSKPAEVIREPIQAARGWDERNIPERYVLMEFDDVVKHESDKAVLIGERWVPKSQMLEVPELGEYVEAWPVTEWWADKLDE